MTDLLLDPTHAERVYIEGQWVPVDGRIIDVCPLDGATFAEAPDADEQLVSEAIDAARRAFDSGPWRRTTFAERAELLEQLAGALEKRTVELTALSVREWGQTNDEAAQIGRAPAALRTAAAAARASDAGESVQAPGAAGRTRFVPHGVVTAITPWNYPFHLSMVKVAYALAAGNTVVLKPSPVTPLAGLMIAEILDESGLLPPGVVNVVTTASAECSALLTSDPRVDMVSFTGSTAVGKTIMRAAADTMKRLVLELGGKSASLVLPDADLDAAADHAAVDGCIRHAGQVCSLYGRLLVPAGVHDEMVDRIAARLGAVRVGDNRFEDVEMGPVVSAAQHRHVMGLIEAAKEDGATVVTGGHAIESSGFYVEPTLLTGATPYSRIAQTEVFGPVLTVLPYDSVDEAVTLANGTPYGLAASVWGADAEAAVAVGERLHAGQVSVNGAPPLGSFGGHRQSGIGREHGLAGLRGYGEPITVSRPASDRVGVA